MIFKRKIEAAATSTLWLAIDTTGTTRVGKIQTDKDGKKYILQAGKRYEIKPHTAKVYN